ncbi:UDP-glycosyltransferase UGT5-like [Lucilia sericata]|uniref:UDP-glycosyltransferase UGT5-like n=1 Tax=Lucilia sericata TaxID=13632 RepID=UPI0018A8277A|nr:UDP-glycosyltransferase UGT5-like [Lucilia sericata]
MINKFKFLTIIVALTFCLAPQQTEAANILAFLPSCSPSHLIIEMAVVKAMAERQHNVTVVSVLPLKSDWMHPSMTHIKLDKGEVDMDVAIKITKLKGFEKFRKSLDMMKMMSAQLAVIFEDPKFQDLLHNPGNKFDLMLFGYLFGDFFFGIAEHFDCPVALLWPNIPISSILNMIGNPLALSYSVVTLLNSMNDDHIDFMFRLKNVAAVAGELLMLSTQERSLREVYAKNFPADKYVSYDKAKERVAMVLYSHHYSEKPVRPLVPALIEIGGIHINDEPKALAKDLNDFINSAENGVIFFSMGTNIKTHHMPDKALEKIFNVLSKLPQKVVWKVDDESNVPGNSTNILYRKWLPQSDILGHPNVKLFFGHGGKGGITEAKFYGVPIVGMPIFGDQPMNMVEVVSKGYGLSINNDEPLTEEIIYETVKEVLENPKYANTVKRFSLLYRDRPLKAKETAVYWLEYLIRYKGAPHMQSPLKTMSFVEATNLDVIAFILAVLYVIIKLIKLLTKFVIKLMCRVLGRKVKRD